MKLLAQHIKIRFVSERQKCSKKNVVQLSKYYCGKYCPPQLINQFKLIKFVFKHSPFFHQNYGERVNKILFFSSGSPNCWCV